MINEYIKYINNMTQQFSGYLMPFQTSGINHNETKNISEHINLISQYPNSETQVKPYPLIFVHGAFAGAWCWQENFMPYFAEQGYVCHALNLRGHGSNQLNLGGLFNPISLKDYVHDLEKTIYETLGLKSEDVVLIGHSMGGMIIQKYLETHNVKGSVLMASVPPKGVFSPYVQTAIRNPMLFNEITLFQSFGPILGYMATSHDTMKRALFSSDMPNEKIRYYFDTFGQVGSEPMQVIFDMMWFNLPNVSRINRENRGQMLVVGGKDDAFFPENEVINTAKSYGAYYKIFDHMAHAMMLEEDWQDVSSYIELWLSEIIY